MFFFRGDRRVILVLDSLGKFIFRVRLVTYFMRFVLSTTVMT